ncbi:MAG: hypothetical protein IKK84_00075 [Clostridia bacterium]|nr:hypothetical protein [Clostridia bacterium]
MYQAILIKSYGYESLAWNFDTEKEALDFITVCLRNGYTMKLERNTKEGKNE